MKFNPAWRTTTSDQWLLRLVDANLAGTIFVLPFLMGGRHPWGQLLLVVLALGAAIGWLFRQSQSEKVTWISTPMRFVFIAAVGLLILQIVPLPAAIQDWVSPNIRNLLPLSNGDSRADGFVRWNHLSFMPVATESGLVTLLAYILLFTTAVQRLREVSDIERMLKWIASAAIAMATFGLLQYLLGNGRFFWFYEHPFRDTNDVVKGAFINRNHFAHFLALGIPAILWWLARRMNAETSGRPGAGFSRRRQAKAFPIWLWLGLGVVWLAGLLSLSRGGIGAMVVATAASLYLMRRSAPLNPHLKWAMVGLAGLIAVGVVIHGSQGVLNRLDDVASGSLERLDRSSSRRQIWSADFQAVKEFLLFGTGVGTHAAVYPIYFPKSDDELEYTHAESGYLQVALETGAVGLALTLATIAIVGRWCFVALRESESKRALACLAAVTASLFASAIHSLVDFVWFIPACMASTVILAACAYRLWLLAGGATRLAQYSRQISVMKFRYAIYAVTACGIWMVALSLGPALAAPAWDRYLRLSVASTKADLLAADEAAKNSSAVSGPSAQLARHKIDLKTMIAELETVARFDSGNVLAQVRLAAARLQWFELLQQDAELPMPLAAVRDAALQSHFQSRAELQAWLSRAIGPHSEELEQARQEIRRALVLCPLYGEAYLYMNDLCFLEGTNSTAKSRYLSQALAVRPYDGEVQFEAGKECFLERQSNEAIEHWRMAYQSGQEFKTRLIELFANDLAAEVPIDFFLKNFQPDLDGLRQLRVHYRQSALAEQRKALWQYSAEEITKQAATQQDTAACLLWLEAEAIYRDLGDAPARLACVQKAVAADAVNYGAHYAAVNCFYDQNEYDNAEEHAKWCLARAPNDANLKHIRDTVVKARLDAPQRRETANNKKDDQQTADLRVMGSRTAVSSPTTR